MHAITGRMWILFVVAVILLAGRVAAVTASDEKRWTEAELVSAYKDLSLRGELDRAVRSPSRPSDPQAPAFLEALAWFAAGTPNRAGALTLAELDAFIDGQATLYRDLLAAKVDAGAANDYPRTRTWKVVQKLMLLRDEMGRAPHSGRYGYPSLPRATSEIDLWDRAHTLGSAEELAQKVCRVESRRPVLVKYGNTNCTQCMLFELTGAVKSYADGAAQRGPVDVYKVWFGFRPDSSFAGRIRDPQRLDELAKAEGVQSSPYFIVYRQGRRYPCGDAFPDASGSEARLDSCLAKGGDEAPMASFCAKP